jgi:hypothetical protein
MKNDIVSVNFDTDENGANLQIDYKRWIGFIRTNSSNEIVKFMMKNNKIHFYNVNENHTSFTVGNTPEIVDWSELLPTNKIEEFQIGAYVDGTTTGTLFVTIDNIPGTYEESFIYRYDDTTSNTPEWTSWNPTFSIPFSSDYRYNTSGSTINMYLTVRTITIIR